MGVNNGSVIESFIQLLGNQKDLPKQSLQIKNTLLLQQSVCNQRLCQYIDGSTKNSTMVLDKTNEVTEHLESLKKVLQEINVFYTSLKKDIIDRRYNHRFSVAHKNLTRVKNAYLNLSDLRNKSLRVEALINQDKSTGLPNNILLIYCYVTKLEQLQETAELTNNDNDGNSKISDNLQVIFKTTLKPLGEFEKYLWHHVNKLLTYIHGKNIKAIRDIFDIIKHVEMIEKHKMKIHQASNTEAETAHRFFNINLITSKKTHEKQYKTKMKASLESQITNYFQRRLRDNTTVAEILNNVETFLETDLSYIKEMIVPALNVTPIDLLKFFIEKYHVEIIRSVNLCLKNDNSPSGIFSLLMFEKKYISILSNYPIHYNLLQPPIIANRTQLKHNYITSSIKSISGWIKNLMVKIGNELEGIEEPMVDVNGKYISSTANIFFHIVSQTLTTASEINDEDFLVEMAQGIVKPVNKFQESIVSLINTSTRKACDSLVEMSGIDNFLIMLGNNSMRWSESLYEISSKIEKKVKGQAKINIQHIFDEMGDSLVFISKTVKDAVRKIIIQTTKPAYTTLFLEDWYTKKSPSVEIVMVTFEDYLHDFQVVSFEVLFEWIVNDLFKHYIKMYLCIMTAKKAIFKVKKNKKVLLSRFNDDKDLCIKLFSKYIDMNVISSGYHPIDSIINIISTPYESLFIEVFKLWKHYPDIKIQYITKILQNRDDYNKDTVNDIISTLIEKIQTENADVSSMTLSVFNDI